MTDYTPTGESDEDLGIGQAAPAASSGRAATAGLVPTGESDADLGVMAAPAPVTLKGIGKQILTGAEEVPYRLAGAPVDLANLGERAGVGAINKMFGTKTEPKQFPGGYEDLTKWAGKVHPSLDPNTMPAQNLPERMARSAGTAMGAVGAAPLAAEAIPGGLGTAARYMAGSPSVGALPAAAASGAGSQYGGEYGSTIWDPKEHPYLSSAAGTAGALIGGGAAGLATRAPAAMVAAGPEKQALVEAGQRIGAPPPRYMVGAPTTQATGEFLHSVPVAGTPIDVGNHKFLGQLGSAADRTASGLGSGEVLPAGQAAQSGLKNWIGPVSRGNVSQAYNKVDSLVNPNIAAPLSKTMQVAQQIAQERADANLPGYGSAIDKVLPAITNPTGLNYPGIKKLTTTVGEMLDNPSMIPGDTSQADLKRIYGALKDDRTAVATAAGGPQAAQALQQADVLNRATAIRRAELSKLLGSKDPNSDSPEAVFGNMQRAAGTTSAANVGLLAKAKSAVSPQDWNELTSGMVGQMGRDNEGNFSPNRFLTDYGKISSDAKDQLFGQAGAQTRQNLDDLAKLSGMAKDVHSSYGNPSGTGHVVASMEILRHLMEGFKEGPWEGSVNAAQVGASVMGGRQLGSFLATPAGSGAAAQFAKSYGSWVKAPSEQTLQQMKFASQRVSGAMAAQYGARVNPDMITRAAMGAQPAAADQGQMTPAPGQQQPDQSKQDQ